MKKYIVIASIGGALAVTLGAFGAHALKSVLTATQLNSFETGVRYQIIHSLLLLVVIVIPILSEPQKKIIANLLISGVLAFSGSIYLLTLGVIPAKYIWFVTPVGGLLLLLAWTMLAIYTLKYKEE